VHDQDPAVQYVFRGDHTAILRRQAANEGVEKSPSGCRTAGGLRHIARSRRAIMSVMDDVIARSMAKWPDVPDVYGWLSLDRRGNWLLKSERIGNQALKDFISRNYTPDSRGCWYF